MKSENDSSDDEIYDNQIKRAPKYPDYKRSDDLGSIYFKFIYILIKIQKYI